ncbi:copper chaperone PCu(A)C [Streptomyces sp. NPDC046876]|uniref:copper chaperone PCu(A)C n=1 Tax=Streptomyces sp. NPDC046876 TaxID=3155616 RepID=UPI0033D46D97
MTASDRPNGETRGVPVRGRLREAYLAAAVPVIAALAALCGLTAWTSSGAAGNPPRIEVTGARVFVPYADKKDTAAFFRISNTGGADDELVSVSSPAVERAMLSRHETAGTGTHSMGMNGPVRLPAGGTLVMSPFDLEVMVRSRAGWKPGDAVPFVLHFRHSGSVEAVALAVRPGS